MSVTFIEAEFTTQATTKTLISVYLDVQLVDQRAMSSPKDITSSTHVHSSIVVQPHKSSSFLSDRDLILSNGGGVVNSIAQVVYLKRKYDH